MKVWLRVPVQVEPKEKDPRRSKGLIPRDFWVPVRMKYPPTVGLQLMDVPGVPFVSMPPIAHVFYRCPEGRYSCHVEPFTFHDIDQYAICVDRMEETFGNDLPPEK